MLFDAHTRSFGALGGVPRRGIYDNMKTAVDKVNKGKGRTVNARFFRDVRAPSVRSGPLQRGIWLGERYRRKERVGQPKTNLARCSKLHVPYLRGAERLARPTLSYALGRTYTSAVQRFDGGRSPGAGAG